MFAVQYVVAGKGGKEVEECLGPQAWLMVGVAWSQRGCFADDLVLLARGQGDEGGGGLSKAVHWCALAQGCWCRTLNPVVQNGVWAMRAQRHQLFGQRRSVDVCAAHV